MLGSDWDDLQASLYFTRHTDSAPFNWLFAAMYYLIVTKMTNMGYLIPCPSHTLKEKIFKEMIHGMEKYLVSAELIGYLKWLIYIATFKNRGNVDHLIFYNKVFVFLNHFNNQRLRGLH